ncbi:MAG: aminotransferase class V-fold PLP-dependent enzyme, partial [Candidatus Brocadiales bacterium]
ETGIEKIMRHGHQLLTKMLDGIQGDDRFTLYGPTGTENRMPIVSLNIKGLEPSLAGSILDGTYGIAARSGLHCAPFTHKIMGTFPQGAVRISPGYFNTADDIVQLLTALKEIASSVKTTAE